MIKKAALGLLAVIALFLAYVAAKPSDYTVSREIAINAPAERVFPYLNNSKLAEKWGPWAEVDPTVKMQYSGPDEGVGSRAYWQGAKQLGTGSATISESVPNERVRIRLEYTEPMAMVQDAEYSIRRAGEQSVVTWSVRGKNGFMGRLMCTFVNMDKMVGGFFEKGLSKLKGLVEQAR